MLSEKLGDVDRRIIEILRRNARTPFTNIGRELGISDAMVHVRVKRMVDEGIIKGYTIDVNKATAFGRMVRRAVRVVRDSKIIKILADPARREILRQVAIQPQTGTQLAKKLHLTKSTIGHHLQALREAGLIDIERAEVGSHGILEKYYEPTSNLFIEDFEGATPKPMRDFSTFAFAYFLHASMDRLIGALSVLHLIEEKRGHGIKIGPEQLKELALEIARHVARVGERYEKMELDMNREMLSVKIYSEALKAVMAESRWKELFARIDTLLKP